jgi:hypothetical protein
VTARVEQLQLTLEVSTSSKTVPDASTFKLAGALISVERQLVIGQAVHVVVTDTAGEVLLESDAKTRAVGFKHHKETKSQPAWLERHHTISLDDPDEGSE